MANYKQIRNIEIIKLDNSDKIEFSYEVLGNNILLVVSFNGVKYIIGTFTKNLILKSVLIDKIMDDYIDGKIEISCRKRLVAI